MDSAMYSPSYDWLRTGSIQITEPNLAGLHNKENSASVTLRHRLVQARAWAKHMGN